MSVSGLDRVNPFAASHAALSAAVTAVRRALAPFPSSLVDSELQPDDVRGSEFVAYTQSLSELAGLLNYATLAVGVATERELCVATGAERRRDVRSIRAQAMTAHKHTYRAYMALWDVAARSEQAAARPAP